MDLTAYHASAAEQERVASLMRMLPTGLANALDIGARDGFLTGMLADRFDSVTALDLELPRIEHERISCVKGNAGALEFADNSFDLVFCAEVLEHIASPTLEAACREIARVARRHVLIGVPYKQDIRVGRVTCGQCGEISPPWGHVNRFDQGRLQQLFAGLAVARTEFVGIGDAPSNALSVRLMDWAGNPYGPYEQEEPCPTCGASFTAPPPRTTLQRVCTRAAVSVRELQRRFVKPHGNWVHLLLSKPDRG